MKPVFADTFYYLALVAPNDPAHARAVALTRELQTRVVTTGWVLMEVGDALAAPQNRKLFARLLDGLRRNRNFKIVPADEKLFNKGVELYRSRPDKGWTLTDGTSFVVMQRAGVTDALTGDHHFEQAGFKALLR
jgi:hypothetical protein